MNKGWNKILTLIPNIYFKLHQPDNILILKVANEYIKAEK